MSTMHNIELTLGYVRSTAEWLVIRGNVAYTIPYGISVQDFMVMHAEDYHWEKCQEWSGSMAHSKFYQELLNINLVYDGEIHDGEFHTLWWKARGRGIFPFQNQGQWSDIMFCAEWLRERVSEVEQECMMRILSLEAA